VAGRHVAGWDVGGVNTKVAHVERGQIASVCGRPFELQRAADRLVALLRELASEAGCPAGSADVLHAVGVTDSFTRIQDSEILLDPDTLAPVAKKLGAE